MTRMVQWLMSRVAVIYIIIFLFCITCLDFKMIEMRVKVRHLNDAIPNFSDMIVFSRDPSARKDMDWGPYKNYFKLILSYLPDDMITRQLLGYVEYHTGQEQEAIQLFKSSTMINGHDLFWSNYNLGVLYYQKGMWAQASVYLLKAIESNLKLMAYFMQDSLIYKQIFISPYFKYSVMDELKNAQAQAFILLLSSLDNMKQYDKMVMIADLGLENQDPSYKDAFYFDAGLAYFEMGQYKNAFVLFQKSLAIEKNNPDVYYYIATIYQKAGQLEQAREFLQVSYALHQKNDPRFPYEAQVNLRFF
jgi:tetratricopeptide (TPR) repeat protein